MSSAFRHPIRWAVYWWRHPVEFFRMPIAKWLDRRYPLACWADLCTWAMGWKDDRTLRERLAPARMCRQDADRNGMCWCGKLQNAERMKELGYEPQPGSLAKVEAPQ